MTQKCDDGPVARFISWLLVPILYSDYRRMMIRCHMLSVRLALLSLLVSVVSPFATPGLLRLLRGWFERLRADVGEFGRAVHTSRRRTTPPMAPVAEWQNPWV
jgi:hypothetical protein